MGSREKWLYFSYPQFLYSYPAIGREVLEAVSVDFAERWFVNEVLRQHDLAVLEETHVRLHLRVLLCTIRTDIGCPFSAGSKFSMHVVMSCEC